MDGNIEALIPILSTLSNRTNLLLLSVLSQTEPLTVNEVNDRIKMLKVKLVYRESTYKALMRLVKQGLVEKTYIMEKGICYSLNKSKLVIDFLKREWRLE